MIQSLAANDHFAVQVGLFLNPKLSDFESIKPLGYLYAEEDEGSTFRVFVGDFDNVQAAAAAESQIRQSGFSDAAVVRRSTTLGKSVAVIQLATRSYKEKINWAPFYEVGNIFVLIENNQLKIVTGTYANVNDAKLELSKIKVKGFKDAFPKIINNALLHQPGAFELGDFKQPLIPLALDAQKK
ncbi:MAG: SPOR domain-containing protein [Saprospiraceae bacterium]|nr:SPOR domain-containing protein [Saprospiraceae bacterium]